MRVTPHLMLATSHIPNRTTVLMYHGVPQRAESSDALDGASFEKQITCLRQYADFIHARELFETSSVSRRPRLLLTFDDGMRNQARVAAPILRKHRVPALFFVSTYHCKPGLYLWFNYFRLLARHYPHHVLIFRGDALDMSPARRVHTVQALMSSLLHEQPHPEAMYRALENDLPDLSCFVPAHILEDQAAGMSLEDLRGLASDPLFQLAFHTHHHAVLTRCSDNQIHSELEMNRSILESIGARDLSRIAYPCGMADARVQRACLAYGISQGFGTDRDDQAPSALSLPRLGIYKASTIECLLKLTLADHINAPWLWPMRRTFAHLRHRVTSAPELISFHA